jgi:hypothetical protein
MTTMVAFPAFYKQFNRDSDQAIFGASRVLSEEALGDLPGDVPGKRTSESKRHSIRLNEEGSLT